MWLNSSFTSNNRITLTALLTVNFPNRSYNLPPVRALSGPLINYLSVGMGLRQPGGGFSGGGGVDVRGLPNSYGAGWAADYSQVSLGSYAYVNRASVFWTRLSGLCQSLFDSSALIKPCGVSDLIMAGSTRLTLRALTGSNLFSAESLPSFWSLQLTSQLNVYNEFLK